MSTTPPEIEAMIAREKSKQPKREPRGVCTLSFGSGDVIGEGMTEEACAATARLTHATGVTWVGEQTMPGEEIN